MLWKRHTLIDISDAGREAILSELAGDNPLLREKFGNVLLPERAGSRIPGIVRREELAPRYGCVAVGFCSPETGDEGRMRIAAFTCPENVVRVTTPYELMSLPISLRTLSTRALAAARTEAEALDLPLGVWGSVALELCTGLPYTHSDSDLDLLVAAVSRETLQRFLKAIQGVEERFALRIDVEVDLPNGYGVHLKELMGATCTVIGKSHTGVELFLNEQIMAELPP